MEGPCIKSHVEKTRSNGYKLHRDRFPLDIRNKLFIVRAMIERNKIPRGVAESLPPEVFVMPLDGCWVILSRLPSLPNVGSGHLSRSHPTRAVLWFCDTLWWVFCGIGQLGGELNCDSGVQLNG